MPTAPLNRSFSKHVNAACCTSHTWLQSCVNLTGSMLRQNHPVTAVTKQLLVWQRERLMKTLAAFQTHSNNLWSEKFGEKGVHERVRRWKSPSELTAAAYQGSIFIPLMWPHLQGEIITALLVNGRHAWMVKGGAGLVNEQHAFQSQLTQAANPNFESRPPHHNVFVGAVLLIVTCSNHTFP